MVDNILKAMHLFKRGSIADLGGFMAICPQNDKFASLSINRTIVEPIEYINTLFLWDSIPQQFFF